MLSCSAASRILLLWLDVVGVLSESQNPKAPAARREASADMTTDAVPRVLLDLLGHY